MLLKTPKTKNRCILFIGIFLLNISLNSLASVYRTSALSYQQNVGVSFTFNSTIGVSLSSADIYIYNLAPGTVSDSNIVTVNILTNTTNGYTLNASVGNDSTFASAERNLVHSNSNFNNLFSSIDFGSSLAANTDLNENTWGYSYSNDDGTTWSSYSGLPLYSDTTNIATLKTSTEPVTSTTGDKVKFKIAAKASSTQPSGEYNNVINFTLVATPIPMTLEMAYANAGKEKYLGYYKMQDMTSDICNNTEVIGEGSVTELIDIRDDNVYTATKFADGKCWMTKNLRLIPDSYATITAENTNNPTTHFIRRADSDWGDYTNLTWCIDYNQSCIDKMSYSTINIGDTSTDSTGHTYDDYGVYYNWWTATAGNGTYEMTSGNAAGDICPYGWRLPTGGTGGEFYALNQAINNGSTNTSAGLLAAPANFVYSGYVNGSSLSNRGYYGYFWSSTAHNSNGAYHLGLYSSALNPGTNYNSKYYGFPARCVAGS